MAGYERIDAEFDWNVQKGCEDDLEVLTRATRKFLESRPDKPIASQRVSIGRAELCKMLGQIIEDGFLADVKQLRETLIEINNSRIRSQLGIIEQNLRKIRELESEARKQAQTNAQLAVALEDLESKIRAHDGEITEPDPALASAKRAYKFMFNETKDKSLASKAFNSFLLRGINEGTVEMANAEEIIKEAKENTDYYWRTFE